MKPILCPRCGHACGNEVDYQRRLTLRCQYCLYTGGKVTDGRQLMNIGIMAANFGPHSATPRQTGILRDIEE